MTCQQILDFLGEYLNGDLSILARLRFEAHLALCPPCREYLDSYRQTIHLAQTWGGAAPSDPCEAVPEDLIQAILQARLADAETPSDSPPANHTGD